MVQMRLMAVHQVDAVLVGWQGLAASLGGTVQGHVISPEDVVKESQVLT